MKYQGCGFRCFYPYKLKHVICPERKQHFFLFRVHFNYLLTKKGFCLVFFRNIVWTNQKCCGNYPSPFQYDIILRIMYNVYVRSSKILNTIENVSVRFINFCAYTILISESDGSLEQTLPKVVCGRHFIDEVCESSHSTTTRNWPVSKDGYYT
jgi:hypothetical protein